MLGVLLLVSPGYPDVVFFHQSSGGFTLLKRRGGKSRGRR